MDNISCGITIIPILKYNIILNTITYLSIYLYEQPSYAEVHYCKYSIQYYYSGRYCMFEIFI